MGIIIVTLYSRNDNEVWKGTQVFNDSKTIVAANQIVESRLGNEFIFWIEQSEQASSAVSEEEEQKILKRITDVGNKIVEYDVYQDMVDDIKLKNNS